MGVKLRYVMDNVTYFVFLIMFIYGVRTLIELDMMVHAMQTIVFGTGLLSLNVAISRIGDEEIDEKTKTYLWFISITIGVIVALYIFYYNPPLNPSDMVSV